MNTNEYLGSSAWQMPASSQDLQTLLDDLSLAPGDARIMWTGNAGPFENLQPIFYLGMRTQQETANHHAPAMLFPMAPTSCSGLLTSTTVSNQPVPLVQTYFVMVDYPASPCSGPDHCGLPESGIRTKPC